MNIVVYIAAIGMVASMWFVFPISFADAAALSSITFIPSTQSATGTLYMNSSNELVFHNGTSANTLVTQSAGVTQVPAAGITQGIFGSSVAGSNNQYIFKPATNSTAMFAVQTAAGGTVLNVDTTNSRVGIGIAAPTAALHVVGTSQFTDTVNLSATKNIVFANSGVGGSQGGFQWALTNDNAYMYAREVTADNTDYYFKISDNTTADRFVWWISDYRGAAWDKYPLTMAGNYASFFNNSLYVENNATGTTAVGNVGVGTATPDEKLDVEGRLKITGNQTLAAGATGPIFANVSGFGLQVSTLKFGVATNNGTTPNFVIESNGNVGIGNTSPGVYKLNVTGSSTISGNLDVSGTISGALSGTFTGTTPAASVTTGVFGSNAYYRFNDAAGAVLLYTDATNSRVGVGTAAPGYKFTVVNGGTSSAIPVTFDIGFTGSSANFGGLQLYRSATSTAGQGSSLVFSALDSGAALQEYAGVNGLIESPTAGAEGGALAFLVTQGGVSRVEKMRIASNGNVGIGKTVPAGKLDVDSGGTAEGYWLDGKASMTGESAGQWLRLNTNSSWTNGIYTPSVFRADGEIRQGSADAGAYGIQTSGAIYSAGNAILAATSGGIGAGTTNPGTNKLSVTGTTYLNGVTTHTDRSVWNQQGDYLHVGYEDATWQGYIGLNTYHNGTNWVQATAGYGGVGSSLVMDNNFNFTYNASGGGVGTVVTPVSRVFIQGSTGYVGIGTTTPAYPLEVEPSSAISADMSTGRIQNVGSPVNPTDAATRSFVESSIAGASGSTVGYWTASSTDIYNSNANNVGIGAASTPNYKLKVFGTFAADSGLIYTDNAGTLTGTAFYDRNNAAYFIDPSATISLKTAGNIILGGTGTPAARLDVIGNINFGLRQSGGAQPGYLSNSWTATESYKFFALGSTYFNGTNWITNEGTGFGSNNVAVVAADTGGIKFYTQATTGNTQRTDTTATFNGYQRMVIAMNGNVGIGIADPGTNKLYVNGATYINGNLALGANNISLTGNISNVTKLTVQTIDPLYEIDGEKYATYAASVAGGVKEEYVGKGVLSACRKECRYEIDFMDVDKGSDLWVWYNAVDFSKDNIEALAMPYGAPADMYYTVRGSILSFYGDRPAEFSYRLIGKRHDWKNWPTYAKDQAESPSFSIQAKPSSRSKSE